jgi:hypothetical protein
MTFFSTAIVSVLLAFSGITAGSTADEIPIPEILATSTVKEITFDSEIARLSNKYNFSEAKARKIIKCESLIYGQAAENKNYDENGIFWSTDIGYWHEATAKKMGYDIRNWKDNLEYGAILLSRDGDRHWSASQYCWKNWNTE